MSRKVITLEIDAEDEDLIRGYANYVGEMKDLARSEDEGRAAAMLSFVM